MINKKHILLLPRWYPNKKDIQLGTFIQKQAILLKDDFHIHVIYVQSEPFLNQTFEIETQKINGIDERIVYYKSAKGPLRKIINARRYKKAQELAYIVEPFQADLCHVHVPYRPAFLALKLLRSGIPFVITEHWSGHLTGEYQKKNRTDKKFYRAVLAKASKISTVSGLLQIRFKENTGFDSIVIPNLIEIEQQRKVPKKSSKIEILSVSDFTDKVKNITGLIRAFAKANESQKNLHLTLIGGGADEETIGKLIKDLSIDTSITLKGRLGHAATLKAYHQCDFYICNSNFETFGMTVAEALMAGKPIISTKCGGPEEFLHPLNSTQIEVKNNEQLYHAIVDMAGEYMSYDSKTISEEIQLKFGAAKVKKQWCDFYFNALE